eukprot:1266500-Rhodomonas_salina.1
MKHEQDAIEIEDETCWTCIGCNHDGNSVFSPNCVMCGALPQKCQHCERLTRQEVACMHCSKPEYSLMRSKVARSKTKTRKPGTVSQLPVGSKVVLSPSFRQVDLETGSGLFMNGSVGCLLDFCGNGELLVETSNGTVITVSEDCVALLPETSSGDDLQMMKAKLPVRLTELDRSSQCDMSQALCHELPNRHLWIDTANPRADVSHESALNEIVEESRKVLNQGGELDGERASCHTLQSTNGPARIRGTDAQAPDVREWRPIQSVVELVSRQDEEGNTAAHYLAAAQLPRTLQAVHERGGSRYMENKEG